MKLVRKTQTKRHKNSQVCLAIEYPLGDKKINGAVIKLKGRYPDHGRVVNLRCKELAFIIRGNGNVVVEGQKLELNPGDLVLIEPGEKYYWQGNLTMFVPSAPAWYPEQHRETD
ncbi:MAG TPA: cupin domain-containing protein [Candidatus Bathyarchaeia archaeon]|nr:cupin domain-containing protein [Candidatus Bathyarchaeia archaeon]